MSTKIINIRELNDFTGSLGELARIVNLLIEQYGANSSIIFDAGFSNITATLLKEKDEKTLL